MQFTTQETQWLTQQTLMSMVDSDPSPAQVAGYVFGAFVNVARLGERLRQSSDREGADKKLASDYVTGVETNVNRYLADPANLLVDYGQRRATYQRYAVSSEDTALFGAMYTMDRLIAITGAAIQWLPRLLPKDQADFFLGEQQFFWDLQQYLIKKKDERGNQHESSSGSSN